MQAKHIHIKKCNIIFHEKYSLSSNHLSNISTTLGPTSSNFPHCSWILITQFPKVLHCLWQAEVKNKDCFCSWLFIRHDQGTSQFLLFLCPKCQSSSRQSPSQAGLYQGQEQLSYCCFRVLEKTIFWASVYPSIRWKGKLDNLLSPCQVWDSKSCQKEEEASPALRR